MRSTKLYIIISVVVLIIVGIIATILSNQLKKSGESTNNKQNAEKVETTGARSLSRTEKYREASRITKKSSTLLLSDDQAKRLEELKSKVKAGGNGMLTTDDFNIGYSDVTNQFYVQKKTDKADAALEAFLKDNNALDIMQTDLSFFVKTDQPLAKYMKDQENYLIEQLDEEPQPSENKNIKSSEITSGSAKIIQDFTTLTDLFKILQPLDLPTPTAQQTNQLSNTAASGTLSPLNLAPSNANGYFMMPMAPNGEYTFGGWNTCESHRYGSKTLIDAIYTAALRWKAKYPQYTFSVRDLNGATKILYPGRGHESHGNGVDVDIVTSGNWDKQINAPTQANIDLGLAFIDTGVVQLIIFGGDQDKYNPRPQLVQTTRVWREYASSKGLLFRSYPTGNHDDHFHVRINDQFKLQEYRPSPCG